MGAQRAHILLPDELIQDIDALVGPRGRSAFLVKSAQTEVQRRRLLQFLGDTTPVWKDENHPELAQGASAWVSSMREQDWHETEATEAVSTAE